MITDLSFRLIPKNLSLIFYSLSKCSFYYFHLVIAWFYYSVNLFSITVLTKKISFSSLALILIQLQFSFSYKGSITDLFYIIWVLSKSGLDCLAISLIFGLNLCVISSRMSLSLESFYSPSRTNLLKFLYI